MVRDDHNYGTIKIADDQELQLRLHSKTVHDWNVSHLGCKKVTNVQAKVFTRNGCNDINGNNCAID